jgi:hypothetical protein
VAKFEGRFSFLFAPAADLQPLAASRRPAAARRQPPTCSRSRQPPTCSRSRQPPTCSRSRQPPTYSRSRQPPTYSRSRQPPTYSRSRQPPTYSRSRQPPTYSRSRQPPICSRPRCSISIGPESFRRRARLIVNVISRKQLNHSPLLPLRTIDAALDSVDLQDKRFRFVVRFLRKVRAENSEFFHHSRLLS